MCPFTKVSFYPLKLRYNNSRQRCKTGLFKVQTTRVQTNNQYQWYNSCTLEGTPPVRSWFTPKATPINLHFWQCTLENEKKLDEWINKLFTFKWRETESTDCFSSPSGQISLKVIKQLSGEHLVGNTSVFKCSLSVMFSIWTKSLNFLLPLSYQEIVVVKITLITPNCSQVHLIFFFSLPILLSPCVDSSVGLGYPNSGTNQGKPF